MKTKQRKLKSLIRNWLKTHNHNTWLKIAQLAVAVS